MPSRRGSPWAARRPRTSSPERRAARAGARRSRRAGHSGGAPGRAAPGPRPGDGEPTRLALLAAKFFDDLNDDVRAATDGSADLATIMPLSFLTLGLAEIAFSREVPAPPWWSLCWWSFRSFH